MQNDRLPIGHELTEGTTHRALTVYGTLTCPDTRRARMVLDEAGVQYNFYDIDRDAGMARTAYALQNGGQKVPVIDFHDDETVLVEPSNSELRAALERTGRLPIA